MICPQCRHENPAGNRFCGSCGTKLPVADVRPESKTPTVNWLKSMEVSRPATPASPTPRDLDLQKVEAEHAAREREIAERAERAQRREREMAERARQKPAAVAAQPQQQQSRTAMRIGSGAPSFLGLSGGYEPDEPERVEEPAEEYDRSDRSDIYGGGGRSYTRAFLLLVLLLVVAGLGFLQWRYSSGLRASAPAEKPSATQPEKPGVEDKQNPAQPSEAKPEADSAEKSEAGATNQNKTDGKTSTTDNEGSSDEQAASEADEPRTGKMQTPAEPEQEATSKPAETKTGTKEAAPEEKAANQPAETKSKPTARRARTESAQVSDEPVRLAESYIYGRGLPQSCKQGVSILREASNRGNYKAQIKLGALYATGNCVSLDRVQAYRFLTRALQGKPGNTWVEQNRSMLWAQMNEQERREAMEQNF